MSRKADESKEKLGGVDGSHEGKMKSKDMLSAARLEGEGVLAGDHDGV